jgi:hypothetical protein
MVIKLTQNLSVNLFFKKKKKMLNKSETIELLPHLLQKNLEMAITWIEGVEQVECKI